MRANLPPLPFRASRLAILLVVGVLIAACSGGAAVAPMPAATAGPAFDALGQAARVPTGPSMDSSGKSSAYAGPGTAPGGPSGQVYDAARPDLLIIKTGTMSLQVKDVAAATSDAATAASSLGGYVSGSQQSGDGDNVIATVTYRVPSARWDDALKAMRGLALKVLDESTQTQDVTGQVVDLSARIVNLRATEAALQAIMTRATKISDVLDVQVQLTTVRGDIEQATAQKQQLQQQASLSTLTVNFSLLPLAAVKITQQQFDPASQVDRATASLVEILQGLATAGIWFAIVWLPVLLVLGVIAAIVVVIVRRRTPRVPAVGATVPQEDPAPADAMASGVEPSPEDDGSAHG